ncbi:MAG: YkgJ family cysteine cluster protein [Gammaproteobacteria bacterium]|nr:YkgJ family cysteine cluster protein [Gammaproteobacteria bacterium]
MRWQDIDVVIEKQLGDQQFACQRGCAWCCHQLIVLTHWEDGRQILAAARGRLTPEEFGVFERRIRDQAQAITKMGHAAAEALQWTCPLLKDGECVVYDLRPVACRSVFSTDAATCQAMMEAEDFDELTDSQQSVANEIGKRAFDLQIAINDQRPVDGPIELRVLLTRLLDEID